MENVNVKCDSRPAWLDIIQSKEIELARIKNVAYAASVEEEREQRERMLQLRHDFEHNLKVISQKENTIQHLQHKVDEIENLHYDEIKEIHLQASEKMDFIEKRLRKELEREFETKDHGRKDLIRRELEQDFETKWNEREKILNKEFTSYIKEKLIEQELQIKAHSQLFFADKEVETKATLEDQRKKIHELQCRNDDLIRENELRCLEKDREWNKLLNDTRNEIIRNVQEEESKMKIHLSSLLNNLEENKSSTVKITGENNAKIEQLSVECYNLQSQIQNLQSELQDATDINTDLLNKKDELLDVIASLEREFIFKRQQFEMEKLEIIEELEARREKVVELENDVNTISSTKERKIVELDRKASQKEKMWLLEKTDLCNQLDEIKKNICDLEEKRRKTISQNNQKLNELRNKESSLRLQISDFEHSNDILMKELSQCKAQLKREREENERIRMQHSELILSQDMVRLQVEEQTTKKCNREMDLKRIDWDKQRIKLQTDSKENESIISSLKIELAKMKLVVQNIEIENKSLKSNEELKSENIENSRMENSRLKDTINIMRKEMDELIQATNLSPLSRCKNINDVCNEHIKTDFSQQTESVCIQSTEALEKQLACCRRYIDALVAVEYKGNIDNDKQNQMSILRHSFGELNQVIDKLRLDNKRLLSTQETLIGLAENEKIHNSVNKVENHASTRGDNVNEDEGQEDEIDNNMKVITDELEIVTQERDQLLSLSNKLRNKLRKQPSGSSTCKEKEEKTRTRVSEGETPASIITQNNFENTNVDMKSSKDEINSIEGLAQSLWSNALKMSQRKEEQRPNHDTKQIENCNVQKSSRSKKTTKLKKVVKDQPMKIRNWNITNDNK